MCREKYLAIDVGGTAIKYTITDKNAKTIKINEIKTIREAEKLFESFDEIIRPHLNQIAGIALSFPALSHNSENHLLQNPSEAVFLQIRCCQNPSG